MRPIPRYSFCTYQLSRAAQALNETDVPELPLGNAPDDLSYDQLDADLCGRLARDCATSQRPQERSVLDDKAAALEAAVAAVPTASTTGKQSQLDGILEYHAAYKSVRRQSPALWSA